MKIINKIFLTLSICFFAIVHTSFAQSAVSAGDIAPDIVLPNPNGINATLSSLGGNIVLVYFWVSWDPGSRAGNAQLDKLYNSYKTANFPGAKGFEFFTVSLDYESIEWTNALRNDRLPGAYHTNDFYSKYAGTYNIDKLPAIFIVDENGVVQLANTNLGTASEWLNQRSGGSAQSTATVPSSTISSQAVTTPPAAATTPAPTKDKNPPAKPAANTNNNAATTPKSGSNVAAETAVTGKNYQIQVGAFKNVTKAYTDALTTYGNVRTEVAGEYKRVLVGNFAKLSDAVGTLKQLQKDGFPDAMIVQYNGNKRERVVTKVEQEEAGSSLPPTLKGGKTKTATTTAAAAPNTQRKATNNGATAKVEWQSMPDPTHPSATKAKVSGSTKTAAAEVTEANVADYYATTTTTTAAVPTEIDAANIAVLKKNKTTITTHQKTTNASVSPAAGAVSRTQTWSNADVDGFTWLEDGTPVPTIGSAVFTPPTTVFGDTEWQTLGANPANMANKTATTAAATETSLADPNFSETYTLVNGVKTYGSLQNGEWSEWQTIEQPTNSTAPALNSTAPAFGTVPMGNSTDRPTYYDFHDPYISPAYTKPSSETGITTKSTPNIAKLSTSVSPPRTTPAPTPAVSSTPPAPAATAPANTDNNRPRANVLNNGAAVNTAPANTATPPVPAATTATPPPAAVTAAPVVSPTTAPAPKVDLDQYLNNYDYIDSSGDGKSKTLKNKEKRNTKKPN